MSFRKFLFSRTFLIQLLLAAVIFVVIISLTMFGLKKYTRNGQSMSVPDFYAMSVDEAKNTAQQFNLKIEIIDSTFNNEVAPGGIIDQVPEKGFKVKENRTIFITINSNSPEQILVPKLTDISFRQAQVLIENCGLQIGTISYSPSEYNDLVLKVLKDSVEVLPGSQLTKGENIDLIIGRDQGNSFTPLPNLAGLSIQEAQTAITNAMLNPGVLIYDESVLSHEDSLNARVWKQKPSPKITANVSLGSSVDLWITIDQIKIDDASTTNF